MSSKAWLQRSLTLESKLAALNDLVELPGSAYGSFREGCTYRAHIHYCKDNTFETQTFADRGVPLVNSLDFLL